MARRLAWQSRIFTDLHNAATPTLPAITKRQDTWQKPCYLPHYAESVDNFPCYLFEKTWKSQQRRTLFV